MEGRGHLRIVFGPLGRYVDDLAVMTRVVLNAERYKQMPVKIKDIYFSPIPFSNEIYEDTKKLRIGYLNSLPIAPACKAN